MDAHVGAKLEVVAPRRVLTPADVGYLLALAAVALGLHAWLVARIEVTARDGLEFARIALNLHQSRVTPAHDGDARRGVQDVLQKTMQHPGYPLAVLGTWEVYRQLNHDELPVQLLKSAQLASLMAAVLMVVPTYWLGRMLFNNKFVGFAAALLFQTLPTIAHLTSDAMSESLYLLLASTALLFGVRGLRRHSVGMVLLCGAFAGLTYLVRPEGVMLVLAIGTTVVGLGVFRVWSPSEAVGRLLALGIGFGFAAGPYMAVIQGFSNKNSFQSLIERINGTAPQPIWQQRQGAVASPLLFADFRGEGNKFAWAAAAIVKETSKASHYAVFALGLMGLVLHRRRIAADPGLAALLVFAVVNVGVLTTLSLKEGYVSERHTVLLVLLLSLFAASALEPLWRRLGLCPNLGSRLLLAGLVAAALPAALKPPHETRLGHPHAGRYLAEHVQPGDAVIDPFTWAEWYAGRSLLGVPTDPQPPAARWVVLEPGKSPHSRLPRYQDALNVVSDTKNVAELKYWWPEDLPRADAEQKAKVLVYRQQGDGR